jgi:SARP family transcriptional regulator, regulator of embCAB operon
MNPTAVGLRDGRQTEGACLRVYLTGPLCIEAGEHVLRESALPGPQGRHMLTMLAAEHARPLSRDELAEELWRGNPPVAWEGSLKALISKLRSSLAAAGLPATKLIANAFGAYQFRLPALGWVDTDAAASGVHLAEAALAAGDPDMTAGNALVTRLITARPFLQGVDGAWANATRQRLRELRIRAIECMAESHLQRGHGSEAIRSAELVLELDDMRESSWRTLMRAHAAVGNLGKALGTYERCRETLDRRLGAVPSASTRATHQELLR